MSELISVALGFLIGTLFMFVMTAVPESQKRIACAKEHNVYECETVTTVRPIQPLKGE